MTTERARGLGRKRRGDRKEESNDSPEIPGRRQVSDIPCLPWKAKTQGPVSGAIWRASRLKLNRTEDASWPGHVEHVQIFPSACFVWWLFQYLYHEIFVLLRLGLLSAQSDIL